MLLLCVMAAGQQAMAQQRDAGLWVDAELKYLITERVGVQLSQSFRINENFSELGSTYTQIGVQRVITPAIKGGVYYRFSQKKQLDESHSLRHLYIVNAICKFEIGRYKFSVREQYQSQYTDVGRSEHSFLAENHLRSKLSIDYDLRKRYAPFMAAEIYYLIQNEGTSFIDNVRLQAGIEYELSKRSGLSLGYLFNKEVNVNNPTTDFVIRTGYQHQF